MYYAGNIYVFTADSWISRTHTDMVYALVLRVVSISERVLSMDSINYRDSHGMTVLYRACLTGNLSMVDMILSQPLADIHLPQGEGLSPIHAAARHGHTDIITRLLSRGENPNTQTPGGQTPLYMACLGGQLQTVVTLIQHGGDLRLSRHDGRTLLHAASETGQVEVIAYLLEAGLGVNAHDDKGVTAILLASEYGHHSAVQILLRARADPQKANKNGTTPLLPACHLGYIQVLTTLLQGGADPNTTQTDGATALHLASQAGHTEVINILLQAGADPKVCAGNHGNTGTPLHVASQEGHSGCASLLIPVSDINRRTSSGMTALALACYNGKDNTVNILLQANADPTVSDQWDKDCLARAAERGHVTCVNLLLQQGVEVRWGHDLCPLTLAARNGHFEVMKLLESYQDGTHGLDQQRQQAPDTDVEMTDQVPTPQETGMRKYTIIIKKSIIIH